MINTKRGDAMEKNSINLIRKEMECCVGQKIQLKSNKGRKKTFVREGVIENAYPSIFTVLFENDYSLTRKASYSYTDILTNAVEVKVVGKLMV
jgi:uncharacterized protein Veg